MEYKTVRGTQEVQPLELERGLTTVYLRKNIHQVTEQTEYGEETFWEYEECQMLIPEYDSYIVGYDQALVDLLGGEA